MCVIRRRKKVFILADDTLYPFDSQLPCIQILVFVLKIQTDWLSQVLWHTEKQYVLQAYLSLLRLKTHMFSVPSYSIPLKQ